MEQQVGSRLRGTLSGRLRRRGWPGWTTYQRHALYTEVGNKPQNTEWCKHTEVASQQGEQSKTQQRSEQQCAHPYTRFLSTCTGLLSRQGNTCTSSVFNLWFGGLTWATSLVVREENTCLSPEWEIGLLLSGLWARQAEESHTLAAEVVAAAGGHLHVPVQPSLSCLARPRCLWDMQQESPTTIPWIKAGKLEKKHSVT